MNGQIIQGLGYRDGEHFEARAFRLGLGTEHVLVDLWRVTRDGQPVSKDLHVDEVHAWLDEHEAASDSDSHQDEGGDAL